MAGPLILCIQDIVSGNNNLNDAVGFYILFVAFGFVYSLPVFLLYLLLFNLLIKKTASILIIKTVLNLTAIIGVFVTIKLIEGTMMTPTLALHYAIALIICSLIYKVKIQNTADT
jgi:Sec-independent protein secretion pathway component TatC